MTRNLNRLRRLTIVPIVLAAATLPVSAQTEASSQPVGTYHCAAGDMTFSVTVNTVPLPRLIADVTVSEMMDQSLARTFPMDQTPIDTGIAYAGTDLWEGDINFAATNQTDGKMTFESGHVLDCEHQSALNITTQTENPDITSNPPQNQSAPLNMPGGSLGGALHSGPGSHHEKVALIPKDRDVTLLSRAGVTENGFEFFKVRIGDGREGYIWGANLCATEEAIQGAYGRCNHDPSERSNSNETHNIPFSAYSWMVFAVNSTGRVGHGVNADIDTAESFAINNCGKDCVIADKVQAKCHVLIDSYGTGYTYGIGHGETRDLAFLQAQDKCSQNAPKDSCQIAYDFCQ